MTARSCLATHLHLTPLRSSSRQAARTLPLALHVQPIQCVLHLSWIIPHLPDSSYTHHRFGKALGKTKRYSNQSLALEGGWIKVYFTVLYQHFFMLFETGQCLLLLKLWYSERVNFATTVLPSKECDKTTSDCAVFLYCLQFLNKDQPPLCLAVFGFVWKNIYSSWKNLPINTALFRIVLYIFLQWFLNPQRYEFMIVG